MPLPGLAPRYENSKMTKAAAKLDITFFLPARSRILRHQTKAKVDWKKKKVIDTHTEHDFHPIVSFQETSIVVSEGISFFFRCVVTVKYYPESTRKGSRIKNRYIPSK